MFDEFTAIDLTLLIDEQYPTTWPPHVPFVRRTWNWFESTSHGPEKWTSNCGPYFTEVLIIDEHIATHFDAPGHFVPEHAPDGEKPIGGDEVPVTAFCGDAVVLDVSAVSTDKPGISPFVGPEHVQAAEQHLGRHLGARDVVLLRSDWDAKFYKPGSAGHGYAYDVAVTKTAPGWPAPNVECIELLLDRGVRCVGTDGPSMGAAHDGAPVHVVGLGGGMVFIEGLANLASIPDNGAYFQFLPLKIARSSGGPGRAIAWVKP